MSNKHVHSTVTHSSRFHCLIGVINKPTMVELCISSSVRPILRIGEYSLVALQHRRIRYIGLRVSADAE